MIKPKWDPELFRRTQAQLAELMWEKMRQRMGVMDWRDAWKESGVSQWIIDQFEHRYGAPPEWLTQLIVDDDKKCGIGKFTLGSSPDCAEHDVIMLLDREGYRIEPIAKTQSRFLVHSIVIGAIGAVTAAVALPKGIIGATVGTILQLIRDNT